MGASMPGQGGGSGRGRRSRPMSEINVTPMVDVMLVLLIIFMVAAPLLTVGIEVDQPEVGETPLRGEDEPLAITINAEGLVYVQDTEVTAEEVVPLLVQVSENNRDVRIFLRADKNVSYGAVADVMSRINAAGFTKVGLPMDPRPGAAITSGAQ